MDVFISCACCGGNNGTIIHKGLTSIYSDQPWNIVECSSCKNIITLPVPSAALLNDIYSKTYLYKVHLSARGEKQYRSKSMAGFIRSIIGPDKKKSLLEVGCMYGYLLEELMNDFKVKGIEIGDDAVGYCKSKGLDVTDTSAEEFFNSNSEKFDVIILSHVFEHLLYPEDVLKKLKQSINPGGKIIISVPNSDSICRKLFGRNWGWWQVPVHINHFRLSALQSMADKNGLILKNIRHKGGDSLMLLLNFINLFGFNRNNKEPGSLETLVILFFTTFFRYWYLFGNEELTVVLQKE